MTTKSIQDIDKIFKSSALGSREYEFHSPLEAPFEISGLPWLKGKNCKFCRLPEKILPDCSEGVQELAWHTSGAASGNCEQSSVFISHYLNHVIGCREEHNFIKIAPALSAFQHISLKNRPFGRCSSPGKLSWNLFQNQEHIQFDLKCDGASPKIKLYLPASEVDLSEVFKVDGGFSEFNLIEDHAVLSFYPGKNKPYSFQCSIKKKLS